MLKNGLVGRSFVGCCRLIGLKTELDLDSSILYLHSAYQSGVCSVVLNLSSDSREDSVTVDKCNVTCVEGNHYVRLDGDVY